MTDDPSSNPNDAWDFVPTCRFHDSCTLPLTPGGCDTCDFMREDVLRDEDGVPIAIPDVPADVPRRSE